MRNRGNNRMKWFMLVAFVFVMVASVEVWGIRAVSAAAKPIKLRVILPTEPEGDIIHPIFSANNVGRGDPFGSNVYEPLLDVGREGEFVPKLATKWEQRGPTTWRFYLRRGVKFHNGADFTARDVVELVKWSLDEKKLSAVNAHVPIKEAVAVDDYTVDLIFEKPQPLLLLKIRHLRIVPTAVSRDNRELAKTQNIGTGPYSFTEWKKGQYVKLTKFKDYWGPKPQIDEVEFTFRGEESVRLAALQAREVDLVYALGAETGSLAPKMARIPGPETVWLRFDEYIQQKFGGVSILADKRLRLAIDCAIDRQALVILYKGFVTPSLGQFASPGDFGFNPKLKSPPYDLEKAKSLVREAGAVGKTITFVGSAERYAKAREVAEAITYMIEKTGLKVKLMFMNDQELNKYKYTDSSAGVDRPYMADILISPTDTLLEVEARYGLIFPGGGRYSAINDPETTRMHNEILAEADYAKRGEKVAKAWAYVYEQVHYVPLYKLNLVWGLAKNLEWNLDIIGRSFIADMRFTD